MANPTSRSELQEYSLRRLGKGVIDINVSTDQIEDRTDEAIQFFQEYHFDGVEKTYLKHKVTATTLTVTDSSQFTIGERITGGTSGASAKVIDWDASNRIVRYYQDINTGFTAFQAAETVTGGTSSASGTVNAANNPEVEPDSGDIMYIEHRRPINRASDQIEDIKLVIEF